MTLYRYTENGIAEENSAYEFIDDWGRTYDAISNPKASANWARQREGFLQQITTHLRKTVNFVIIDLTGFTKQQIQEVRAFIDKNVSAADQQRIIRIGF